MQVAIVRNEKSLKGRHSQAQNCSDYITTQILESELNDNQIALLSDVLRPWRNLQELNIYFDKDVSVAECLLRKLFEAIAGCHRLQILRFEYLEIGDSVVPSVCRMLESLNQLRQFTSENQRDKSLTEEGFKQLEPILKRNELDTVVRSHLVQYLPVKTISEAVSIVLGNRFQFRQVEWTVSTNPKLSWFQPAKYTLMEYLKRKCG
ncbi:hypothetical protein CAPTEDRAFT_202654 [Capitella teleta]|uniref:Uncharacterized protein n=1 Tax=Capitella teleta TaxID=283909 RepID=R7T7X0_CAPTE|nr:hypothetical protein CAPTEDRAFT_202654 [Capitella teleta]|eukprot:ELT89729.1 hypothetical protein CAPTEDRAFT_202654 [Capitella teleta]